MKDLIIALIGCIVCLLLGALIVFINCRDEHNAIEKRIYNYYGEGDTGEMMRSYLIDGIYTDGYGEVREKEFWNIQTETPSTIKIEAIERRKLFFDGRGLKREIIA